MKRRYRLATGMFCLFLMVCVFISAAHSEGKIHTMTGKISVVNTADNVVVIQVPMGAQMFTVGGPIDANATLTKNGRSVELRDFKAGETATVKWRSTPNGHRIQALSVR